jgi:hypothetical protein
MRSQRHDLGASKRLDRHLSELEFQAARVLATKHQFTPVGRQLHDHSGALRARGWWRVRPEDRLLAIWAVAGPKLRVWEDGGVHGVHLAGTGVEEVTSF